MARGVRKTADDKMEELKEAIAREEEKVKELKKQLCRLMQEKQAEELNELMEMIKELGISVGEAREILSGSTGEEASA